MDISTISLSGLSTFDRASQLATQTALDQSQQTAEENTLRSQEAASQTAPTPILPDLENAEGSQPESSEGESRGGNLDVYA